MALSLTAAQITEFEALVKAAYQSEGKIPVDSVRVRNNVIGWNVQFPKIGSVEAQLAGFQTQVVGQDPNFTKVNAILRKYMAPTWLDDIQKLTVNFDSKMEQAKVVGFSMGRRRDQILIDSLIDSATANVIVDGGTGLTYDKIKDINKFFDDAAVPGSRRHIAVSAEAVNDVMSIAQFTDNDFIDKGAVRRGTIDGAFNMSMQWHVIPSMTATTGQSISSPGSAGGLPLTGDIRTLWAWDEQAIGLAVGEIRSEINYVPQVTSWLINGIIFAGAVAIDPIGIVKIDIDESV